ncbi:MAG: BMC domain-containing protein, partial [Dehalococcoidia bacterium]|nr:BMC domain-containing protein [Dehalococcoidia bacterium]
AAGAAILEELGLTESDRLQGQIVSTQIVTNVTPYQAQLVNKTRAGSLLVPGESMLVVEMAPAGYAVVAANEAEKAADVKLISISSIGPAGRIIVSGTNAQVQTARDVVADVVASLKGRPGM